MPKYISSIRREDYLEYADYTRALHESGEPVPDEVLSGTGGGFYGDLLRLIHGGDDQD